MVTDIPWGGGVFVRLITIIRYGEGTSGKNLTSYTLIKCPLSKPGLEVVVISPALRHLKKAKSIAFHTTIESKSVGRTSANETNISKVMGRFWEGVDRSQLSDTLDGQLNLGGS